jgi:hypothetical protein
MAKGWEGANKAEKDDFCAVCKRQGDIRIFHSLREGVEHIFVCKEHANSLSEDWHGCGCGG